MIEFCKVFILVGRAAPDGQKPCVGEKLITGDGKGLVMDEIDFGTLGLKIGDEIVFIKYNTKFIVSSGNGTPGNGGTLVRYSSRNDDRLYSLRYITRRLMDDEFDEPKDIFEAWEFGGEILRNIWRKKQQIK